MGPSIRTMGFFMSEINFCNTKEQLNHLGEVVTGKVDGSPSGADIDTSTLPYTGQVRKTLPALEEEYQADIDNFVQVSDQLIVDKTAELDSTITDFETEATQTITDANVAFDAQRDQFESTFSSQFAYNRIGDISDYVGQSLPETDKLNAYQYPDDSGNWYVAIQGQTFPITIPSNPSTDNGWALVNQRPTYQGLWPDTGGSANKGETWQTQTGGTPTGQYFTALQNTTADPVGDDVNWREVVSNKSVGGLTNYQAASVENMKQGKTLGGQIAITSAMLDGSDISISTQGYYGAWAAMLSPQGNADYIMTTTQRVRDAKSDQAWTPDGYMDHYLFGGADYVAVLIRDNESVYAAQAGAVGRVGIEEYEPLNAASQEAAKTFKTLILPDSLVQSSTTIVIDGEISLFSSFRVKGTFRSTATAVGYVPYNVGSAILTNGKSAFQLKFNTFRNENFDFDGVAFVDKSYYPSGQPKNPFPAVLIEKGNAATPSNARYITGNAFRNCAAYQFNAMCRFQGMVPGAHAANFIGNTELYRVRVSECTNAFQFWNCTLNHMFMTDFVIFGTDQQAFGMQKEGATVGGLGGFLKISMKNGFFEGVNGIFNTNDQFAGPERHTFVFDSVTREASEAFASAGALSTPGRADIFFKGNKDIGIAFGETTNLPIPADVVFNSDSKMKTLNRGGKTDTPKMLNSISESYAINNGETKTYSIRTTNTANEPSGVISNLKFNNGLSGICEVLSFGTISQGAKQEPSTSVPSFLTVAPTTSVNDIAAFTVDNNTGGTLFFNLDAYEVSGRDTFIVIS